MCCFSLNDIFFVNVHCLLWWKCFDVINKWSSSRRIFPPINGMTLMWNFFELRDGVYWFRCGGTYATGMAGRSGLCLPKATCCRLDGRSSWLHQSSSLTWFTGTPSPNTSGKKMYSDLPSTIPEFLVFIDNHPKIGHTRIMWKHYAYVIVNMKRTRFFVSEDECWVI